MSFYNEITLEKFFCNNLPLLQVIAPHSNEKIFYKTLDITQGNALLTSPLMETVINLNDLKNYSLVERGKVLNLAEYFKELRELWLNREIDVYGKYGHVNN